MATKRTALMIAAALTGASPTAVMAQQRVATPTYDQVFNACSRADASFGERFERCMTAQGVEPRASQPQPQVQAQPQPVADVNLPYPVRPVAGQAQAAYLAGTQNCRDQYPRQNQGQLLQSCLRDQQIVFQDAQRNDQERLRVASNFERACQQFARDDQNRRDRNTAIVAGLILGTDRGARTTVGRIALGALTLNTFINGQRAGQTTYQVSRETCGAFTDYTRSVSFSPRQY